MKMVRFVNVHEWSLGDACRAVVFNDRVVLKHRLAPVADTVTMVKRGDVLTSVNPCPVSQEEVRPSRPTVRVLCGVKCAGIGLNVAAVLAPTSSVAANMRSKSGSTAKRRAICG